MHVNDSHQRGFARDLRSRNRSPGTIINYADATRALRAHLQEKDLAEVTADDIVGFLDAQVAKNATTAAIRFRALQQFYKWATAEEVCETNPMLGLRPPMVTDVPVPTVSMDQIKALLKTCDGKTFVERRDNAILRLFLEPGGLRLAEMVGLRTSDVDFNLDVAVVLGKGRRERSVPFGSKTGQALERYVRARRKHALTDRPELWLGYKGPLTRSGVAQMMRRRAVVAGLPRLHPHMLRHTAAHEWLASGGQETDALRLFGWKSREMLGRYGASAADERAQAASKEAALGDRY